MKYIDLTLPTPAKNLACDEALIDWCEEGVGEEVLRFWEPGQPFVVVGYANKVATEVNLPFCRANNIPVLRRPSGGGTVLQLPGVLNYTLVLRIREESPLAGIPGTNAYILERHARALEPLLGAPVSIQGAIDLAINEVKFSGNAQRRKRHYLLYHGTLLLSADLELISKTLLMPSKQPEYRRDREHLEFLTNLNIPAADAKKCLRDAWQAGEALEKVPMDRIESLARDRYSTPAWNEKF